METVDEILRKKGRKVWSVSPDQMVLDAIRLMAEKEIGALLVMDGERVAGIITERDYARKLILAGRSSKDTPVRDVMTSRVLYARPGQPVTECMAVMTETRERHMPVIDEGKVVGIVSIGDLVKAVISEQKFVIEQLQQYIVG